MGKIRAIEASRVWFAGLALLAACGGGTDAGSTVHSDGGGAGTSAAGAGTPLDFGGGGAGGGHAGQSSGGTSGGGALAGSAGAGGSSVPQSKCLGRPQLYCNGACLKTVGETQGKCTALLLEQSQTLGLAVEGSTLYFNHANESVDRMDLGTFVSTPLVSDLSFPRNLVVSGGSLLFTTDWTEDALAAGSSTFLGTVRSVPKAGGQATLIAQAIDHPGPLAVIGNTVYFVGGFGTRVAYSAPLAGGAAQPLGGVLMGDLGSVLFDDSAVFYTQRLGSGISSVAYGALSTPTKIASDNAVNDLVADATYLYFVVYDGEGTQYYRVNKSGGTSEQVAALDRRALFQYRDGATLYFSSSTADAAELLSLPLVGGSFETVATLDWGALSAVTADASNVYVGTNSNGILRIKK